jgi:hypothetical protein
MDLQLVEGIVRMRACVNNPGTFIFFYFMTRHVSPPPSYLEHPKQKIFFPPHHHFVKSNKTGRGSKKFVTGPFTRET